MEKSLSLLLYNQWKYVYELTREGFKFVDLLIEGELTPYVDNAILRLKTEKANFAEGTDIHKTIVRRYQIKPSQVSVDEIRWLNAINDEMHVYENEKVGRWELNFTKEEVDEAWDTILNEIKEKHVWMAKVSPCNEKDFPNNHIILVYMPDYKDIKHVFSTYSQLKKLGFNPLKFTREPLSTSQQVIYEDEKGNLDRLAASVLTSGESFSLPQFCSTSSNEEIATLDSEIKALFDQPLPHSSLDIKNNFFAHKKLFILKNMEIINDLKNLLLSMKITHLNEFAKLNVFYHQLKASSQDLCNYALYASDPHHTYREKPIHWEKHIANQFITTFMIYEIN